MYAVSSLFNAPDSWLVPLAKAASKSARLVMDFDPGGATRPTRGLPGGTIRAALAAVARRGGSGDGARDGTLAVMT